MLLWSADRLARLVIGAAKKVASPSRSELLSPSRRHFLEQSAIALSAAPFVAGTYGLFYERLNLETTHQWIRLRRLPKAFEGFRIVQLSDLHISPFMSADEIRKYVEIANQLRGDLVVVTGDFLTYGSRYAGSCSAGRVGAEGSIWCPRLPRQSRIHDGNRRVDHAPFSEGRRFAFCVRST